MSEVVRFRKKPVVIEAMQYDGTEASMEDVCLWCDGGASFSSDDGLVIHTLEGDHLVSVGDFVIKGVAGEFYPCKPDIFEKTYEKVDE